MAWKSGWRGRAGAALLGLALGGAAWADDPPVTDTSAQPSKYDDTGRLYLTFDTGMNFTLDRHFAGDVKIDPGEGAGMDFILGGNAGYNITRNWGVELQLQGTEPDLRSSSKGKIRELSIITVVPTARYRWHLLDDRLVPYVTGGVGMSFNDTNEEAKPNTSASTDSTTIVGSLSAGFDYFLSEDVAVGLDARYLIHPNQDAAVTFRNPNTFRVTRFDSTTNLTSISLLAHIRVFLGQQADAGDGSERHLFFADHGPFDTGELRFWAAGMFGYDFLFDKNAGGGVRLRDKNGDANFTKGGALGVNFDEHWGAEIQILESPINLRQDDITKIAELDDTAILPSVRYRWQFLGGRLVPFVTAGIGVAYLIVNDPRSLVDVPTSKGFKTIRSPTFDPQSPRVVGSVGGGIEYFLNRHFSIGLYTPFHFYRETDTTVRFANGKTLHGTANFSGFLTLLQVKAYL